nr:retrovirus-related Pol polyprotein from transposon TNT 1-94 [Tanacetum cinerariifolium]
MDSDKYLEGKSMQIPPFFESGSFIYWKNRFETYVKSKDLDLWHVITYGDFQPIQQNPKAKLDEVIPFEKQNDDFKKRLTKNNEAKMVIYNALPRKEYERIFMCITAKEIWKTLLITHQVKAKVERKSHALKVKKESSDEECLTFDSEDEEYAMAVKDLKKFFKRRECPKPPKDKNQRTFVGGSWSDSGEEDDEKICLGVDLEPDEWIKDSGCSRHMTGNRKLFSSYKAYNEGNVIFGSNLRNNIIGKCAISNDSFKIDNVEHVNYLGLNLLSIGKICDNKYRVTFSEYDSEITKDGKVIGRGIRKKGLYVMKLENKPRDKICLATIDENSTLWHKRLGHANMHLIQPLASKELVRNLPKLKFDQHFCDACKMGKQAYASHKAKNIVSTTRCLELLHMDLFGPSAVRSYGGNHYTLIIVDDYSRLEDSKPMKTPMSFDTKLTKDEEIESVDSTKYRGMIGLWYRKGTGIETVVYADSDHAGDYVDRKSTSAEYASAEKACQQALWIKQALIDYDVRLDDIPIMCDNKGAIDLSKNPMQHSRTKHIEIRHQSLCDNVQKGHISIEKMSSVDNIAEILTKPNKRESFNYLRLHLEMMKHIPTQNHPSISLLLDATSDENDDESFHSYSFSSSQNISSSSNVFLRVCQNLPHESHDLNTYLFETINIQTQQRDAHRDGFRSIGQAIKDMMSGK